MHYSLSKKEENQAKPQCAQKCAAQKCAAGGELLLTAIASVTQQRSKQLSLLTLD